MIPMIPIQLETLAFKVVVILVALLVGFGVLRYFDYRAGIVWSLTWGSIRNDPRAAAVYLGCRILAVYFVVGVVLAFS